MFREEHFFDVWLHQNEDTGGQVPVKMGQISLPNTVLTT